MHYTPLYDEYGKHGAKVVDFHGWALPIQFRGILEEHRHVRQKAGLFDCSHMGEFVIKGEQNIRCLSNMVIGDLVNLSLGRCRYTALLNQDGGIIDDCVALRLDTDEMLLVTNAGPLAQVDELLKCHVPLIRNISEDTAKIDVQGPLALDVMAAAGFTGVEALGFWTGRRFTWQDAEVVVTRAGYTGELGYELYVDNELGQRLWRCLVSLPEVAPCGLGARDTLRTEMGYPLSGQDVDESRTPLEASMDRFIDWETDFPGKKVLQEQESSGSYARLVVLRSFDKRAPRHGFELYKDGEPVGLVTSGTFGPSVECGIGLGYVPVSLARPGTRLEAGPRSIPVSIEMPPLYAHATGRNRIKARTLNA